MDETERPVSAPPQKYLSVRGVGSFGLVHQRHALLFPLTWYLPGVTGRAGRVLAD